MYHPKKRCGSLEREAIGILNGFLTETQLSTLPRSIQTFVIVNPDYVRNLMKEKDVTVTHLKELTSQELMGLQIFSKEVNLLLTGAKISFLDLLLMEPYVRMSLIYDATFVIHAIQSKLATLERLISLYIQKQDKSSIPINLTEDEHASTPFASM